jgi:hypothetical protein
LVGVVHDRVIHEKHNGYCKWEFYLWTVPGYSGLVSSTLPKDGFKPALLERAFFSSFSERPKKKPAIDTDAGFPVFSRPQFKVWILWANHAAK